MCSEHGVTEHAGFKYFVHVISFEENTMIISYPKQRILHFEFISQVSCNSVKHKL